MTFRIRNRNIAMYRPGSSDLAAVWEENLKCIYWIECAQIAALQWLGEKAVHPELSHLLDIHIEKTFQQGDRIERCFEFMGKNSDTRKCNIVRSLINDGTSVVQKIEDPVLRDTQIIAMLKKLKHIEIASYESLVDLAIMLKEEACQKALLQNLEEEKKCNELLNCILKNLRDEFDGRNRQAGHPGSGA